MARARRLKAPCGKWGCPICGAPILLHACAAAASVAALAQLLAEATTKGADATTTAHSSRSGPSALRAAASPDPLKPNALASLAGGAPEAHNAATAAVVAVGEGVGAYRAAQDLSHRSGAKSVDAGRAAGADVATTAA